MITTDPENRPYSLLHTRTHDSATLGGNEYMEAWAYVDGMGRTLVTLGESDPVVSGHDWVVNGLTNYDKKGAAERAYLSWYWDGSPDQFPLTYSPTTAYGRQRYDAFGRQIQTFGLDGAETLRTKYHALSTDLYDANDLEPGIHQGTFVTTKKDGHGRATVTVERVHPTSGNSMELRTTKSVYLFSGEVEQIIRERVGSSDPLVKRWMVYDSLGRMIVNVEPHTTTNFVEDPLPWDELPTNMKSWRYAYDDAGELVGTSDARGCGVNFHYDTAGRLLVEDYSPCLDIHQTYSEPEMVNSLFTGVGAEVLYRYDSADPETNAIEAYSPASQQLEAFTVDTSLLLGRMVSVTDRASKTVTRYDGRGRVTGIAKEVAKPGVPEVDPADRFAPRWYVQTAEFDAANRPVKQTTGVQADNLAGNNGESWVGTEYTAQGTVKRVTSSYGTNDGVLVSSIKRDADGVVKQIVYGDAASTTTDFTHDTRRRVRTVQTHRNAPSIWSSPPSGYSPIQQTQLPHFSWSCRMMS